MQERSARNDLEMDKSALERQVPLSRSIPAHSLNWSHFWLKSVVHSVPLSFQMKDLKSRLVDMEGPSRPSPALNLLENKIQELEERLHSEERCG